jgi:hypothetical protein
MFTFTGMINCFTTTYIGPSPTVVYHLGYDEKKRPASEKDKPQEDFLDDVEVLLRTYRPDIFSDVEQSS